MLKIKTHTLALVFVSFLLCSNLAFAEETENLQPEAGLADPAAETSETPCENDFAENNPPPLEEKVATEIEAQTQIIEEKIETQKNAEELQTSLTFAKNSPLYQFPRKLKREFWEIPKHNVAPPETENLEANIATAYARETHPTGANFFSPHNLALFGIFISFCVGGFLFWFFRLEKQLNESEIEINRIET